MKRKALAVIVVVLLATSGMLFLRLDPDKISASVQSQLQQWPDQKIRTGSASLSLLHGIGLHISDINIRTNAWHLHADSVQLDFSLWRLLRGEAHIKSADIIRPVLDFSTSPKIKDIAMMSLPESIKQIRIQRGSIRISNMPVVRNFDGMIRRIGGEQKLTWEVQTDLFGGDITTQGRIQRDAQGHSSVFGKLEARHIHLKNIPGDFPRVALPQPAYDTVESSLTFEVNARREWSLFGNASLHTSLKKTPPITWRGKVQGTGLQRLNWHDAFIQIGRKTMLSTVGNCARKKGCHSTIETRDADVPAILKIVNLTAPIKGSLDTKSSVSWKDGQWSAEGKLSLHHTSWADISLPDTTISVSNVLYHKAGHFELAHVRFQPADDAGIIMLDKLIRSGNQWNLDAHIKNISHVWLPITNILFQSHGIKPDFHGNGPLNAEIHASADAEHTGIDFSADGSQAQLGYTKDFEKPKGLRTHIVAHMDMRKNNTTFSVLNMELGSSRAKEMQWVIGQGKIKSVSARHIQLDLAKLVRNGMVFSNGMKDWHGAISGYFTHIQPSTMANIPGWFAQSDAKLELAGFGVGKHQWNGSINIRDGRLSAQNLLWNKAGQHARFDGAINLAPMHGALHGNIDIQDAALSWKQGDTLPVWLNQAKLRGRLRNIDLNWMGNTWGGLHATYRTNGPQIMLGKMRGKLAGGSIQSPKLSLVLSPESVQFSGSVRMAIVRLNKLEGLTEALGAGLDGYMYLNANLEGELPWRAQSLWQGNGDIEIQHGHWQPVDAKLTMTAGSLHPGTGKAAPFSRFTTRFKLDHRALRFARIQLETGTKQITGNAFLHPDGEIGGNLQIKDERGTQTSELTGNWPDATKLFRLNN